MRAATYPALPILVVDDEASALDSGVHILAAAGMNNVISCQDSRDVMGILSDREVGVVLLDLAMPHVTGEELLPRFSEEHPEVPVIVVTGINQIEVAVECMKLGAFDYMVKPVEMNRLISGVRRAVELRELRRENALLTQRMQSSRLENPTTFSGLVTNDGAMHAIFRYVETVASTGRPVLVTGETGVGKELIAQALHTLSGLPGPFVAANIAAVDDNAFSDTLFGHAKGAFTGADEVRAGLVEEASGGTLFLDEIGDLSIASQVKLLRLLQENEYRPLGSETLRRARARIVVATNGDIEALRDSGRFRKDLYYRLQTHRVHVPPLRERKEDLPLLLDHFLEKASRALGKKTPRAPIELPALLATHSFPGNVRELEAMIFDAVSSHRSKVLSMDVFKARIRGTGEETLAPANGEKDDGSPFAYFERLPTLKEAARLLIEEAMKQAGGNQTIAAGLLGISRTALNKRLRQSLD